MRIFHLVIVMIVAFGHAGAVEAPRPANFHGTPIEIIVPFAAGGGMDLSMRIVARHAERELGQSVSVRNLTAGGNIQGNLFAVAAPPDGLIWGSWGMGLVTDQLIVRSATYSYKDVIPVAMVARDALIISVSAAVARQYGITDLEGLLTVVRDNPGKLVFGTGGNWTSHDFVRLRLQEAAGGEFARMPFLGGALATKAVATGNCDVASSFGSEFLPYIDDPRLVPLAVTGETRIEFLPEVPTAIEAGYSGVLQSMWRVVTLPKRTPKPIVDHITQVMIRVMEKPELRAEMREQGFTPFFMTGSELTSFIEEEYQYFEKKTEEWGIRVER